jgi:hypothetical protein
MYNMLKYIFDKIILNIVHKFDIIFLVGVNMRAIPDNVLYFFS